MTGFFFYYERSPMSSNEFAVYGPTQGWIWCVCLCGEVEARLICTALNRLSEHEVIWSRWS